MKITPEHNERMAKMTFASVYPHYVTKIERKGRTKEELHQVIEWLTGFDNRKIQELIDEKATFEAFFKKAKHFDLPLPVNWQTLALHFVWCFHDGGL